jgi:hypothetical protein
MIIPNPHGLIRRVVKSLGVFRLEIADAEERNTERAPADAFRSEMARAEGWDIFDCGVRDDGTPHVELQRVDSPAAGTSRFDTDHAAWEHVVGRARGVRVARAGAATGRCDGAQIDSGVLRSPRPGATRLNQPQPRHP